MEEDAVVQTAWCSVCFRSSDVKWKKHVFTRNHQNKARDFLRKRVELVDACVKQSKSAISCAELRGVSWKCVFCELPVQQGWLDWVEHSAGEAHRKRVEAFCRHHRCDTDREHRERVCLSAASYLQLRADYAAIEERERLIQEAKEVREPGESELSRESAARTEAFLGAAASRLSQQSQTRPRPIVNTPALSMEPQQSALKTAKTVESADGVLQNPLGRHEGRRVWGGGIVKLRKEEWIPWPIDTLVQEELARQFESSSLQDGDDAFALRFTERAVSHGLQQIAPVAWGQQVRNIHTGAVPPWMVQSEDEYKQSNERPIASVAPAHSAVREDHKRTQFGSTKETGRDSTRQKRDIFSKLQETAPDASYGPDWLPKFSGIWQDNQRSSVKRSLQELKRASRTKTAHAPQLPAEKPAAKPSPLPRSLPVATTSPAVSAAPNPAPAATEGQPKDPPAKAIHTTSLDAKKELLLAQKERLRAKLTAKRRP